MCQHNKQVVLPLPINIDTTKTNRSISCDACCVGVIKHLWKNNVDTRSHCCGHGKINPSIVIADGYKDRDIKVILKLIAEIDSRSWDIYQWRLAKVTPSKT